MKLAGIELTIPPHAQRVRPRSLALFVRVNIGCGFVTPCIRTKVNLPDVEASYFVSLIAKRGVWFTLRGWDTIGMHTPARSDQ